MLATRACYVAKLQNAVKSKGRVDLRAGVRVTSQYECVEEVYESRRRIAHKALKHAMNCDVMCEQLSKYSNQPDASDYYLHCKLNAKVAWDIVEEVYSALADIRYLQNLQDPLELHCNENPDADECRCYDA
jgi:transcriptional regulator of met regulon